MLRGKANSLHIKENVRTRRKLRRKHVTQECKLSRTLGFPWCFPVYNSFSTGAQLNQSLELMLKPLMCWKGVGRHSDGNISYDRLYSHTE